MTGILTSMFRCRLHHLTTFAYLTIIMIWAQSIRQRIDEGKVRNRILTACALMVLLFFLRMCKYSYFENVYVLEYIWHAYSISLIGIPLFMFMAALRTEPVGDERCLDIIERILVIVSILFAVAVLTNSLHSQVYHIIVHPDKEYTREWLYYVIVTWRILLSIGTLYVLFRKCSLTAARKKWYIPAICIAASLILLTWYLICGGSPKIGGHKLFQLQEAVCIPFIMAFESIIQIGLIPVNSGFLRLFYHSGINACIYDKDNRPAVVSYNWTDTKGDEDHRVRKETISGGYVTWVEDITAINRLNHQIEEVTEELNNENDLIRQENKVRAERVSFETKNRLYNRIAMAVRTKAVRVDDMLTKLREDMDGDEFRNNIIYSSVLSAYIKRMGNLMILTDGVATLSSKELGLAINESLQYLELKGVICNYTEAGECLLPSKAVLLAYELFETAVEDVWLRPHTIVVALEHEDVFRMTIAMDEAAEAVHFTWKDRELGEAGGRLSVKYEDETYYMILEVTV